MSLALMKKLGFNECNRLALKELKLSLHNYYEKISAIRYKIKLLFLKNLLKLRNLLLLRNFNNLKIILLKLSDLTHPQEYYLKSE